MKIEDVFGSFGVDEFIETHLHRLPLALAGSATTLCSVGSWEALERIVFQPQCDLLIVRRGEQLQNHELADATQLLNIISRGYTVRVRHAELHHAEIKSLANVFEATFESPVDVHFYATPADTFGFSWHYDAEDVFIVQTAGEKEYFLRKNTVNPWPLEETIPADMRYERELMPLMRATLKAGDLLYIPCGYWHRAQANPGSEVAISLAVGVMSRSAMDIFALLRNKLLESLMWRQRLPVTRHLRKEDATIAYNRLLRELASDISKELTSSTFIGQIVDGGRMNAGNRDEGMASKDRGEHATGDDP
jgi:ribosomal protein L16 Arg81 hydroxylase